MDDEVYEGAVSFAVKLNQIIIYPLIALLMGIALLVFVWGVVQYIAGATDETKRSDGRKHMLWGIIGFVVMVSATALLRLALGTFGIEEPAVGL